MKVNNYPLKTPAAGDRLFGSDSNGDQKQFDMSNFSATTYKVYTALLTQTETSPPVATVLENTLSAVPEWSYDSVGEYLLTLIGAFTGNVIINITNGKNNIETIPFVYECQKLNSDSIFLNVKFSNSGEIVNGGLTNASIEIKVYN
ncbi:MAG: hypothetical protein ACOVK2_05930 [Candidatus Fonsibacter sp.]